ncbi:MAG TPA: HAMP domain-containing protein, partial [Polyangiaceae bacterium]|nr:HAMP domain-containing protein [Polyangiaceae bacterium]
MIRRMLGRMLGRIGVRLVVVNLVVLLVPVAGLEFARLYETQLLGALERDMQNQSALVRAEVEERLAAEPRGDMLDVAGSVESIVTRAARTTRTRVRVLDADGAVIADSHRDGPPEGAEQEAPKVLGGSIERAAEDVRWRNTGPKWPDVPAREEVVRALGGAPATKTRIRGRAPAVLLFDAEPVRVDGEVRGAVYVTRSTQPVLLELYRIRSGLIRVLAVALLLTGSATLLLAWSISRPLSKLSKAARRVAAGELSVE